MHSLSHNLVKISDTLHWKAHLACNFSIYNVLLVTDPRCTAFLRARTTQISTRNQHVNGLFDEHTVLPTAVSALHDLCPKTSEG